VLEGNVSSLPEYAIPALPVGSVAGIVTNNAGVPIANATVTALLAQKTYTTGSNGRYSIDNLRTGPEFISVAASAHFPERLSVTITQGGIFPADFALISGVPGPPIPAPVTVEGLVFANGAPAVGAHVWAWNSNREAFTDNNGRYRLNFPEGNFLILAELGSQRGGTELNVPANQTTMTAPDITLVQR
jgi:hypothetical protein